MDRITEHANMLCCIPQNKWEDSSKMEELIILYGESLEVHTLALSVPIPDPVW